MQLRIKIDAAHYYTLKLIERFTNEKRRKKKKKKKKKNEEYVEIFTKTLSFKMLYLQNG